LCQLHSNFPMIFIARKISLISQKPKKNNFTNSHLRVL
jgi:hypothetical protein